MEPALTAAGQTSLQAVRKRARACLAALAAPAARAQMTEAAHDRALATDQSIEIARQEIRRAGLLPWSALAKVTPRLTGNGSYSNSPSSGGGSASPERMDSRGADLTYISSPGAAGLRVWIPSKPCVTNKSFSDLRPGLALRFASLLGSDRSLDFTTMDREKFRKQIF